MLRGTVGLILSAAIALMIGCGGGSGKSPPETPESKGGGTSGLGRQDSVGNVAQGDCVKHKGYFYCGPYARQWCREHPDAIPDQGSCEGVKGWGGSPVKGDGGSGGSGEGGGSSGGGGYSRDPGSGSGGGTETHEDSPAYPGGSGGGGGGGGGGSDGGLPPPSGSDGGAGTDHQGGGSGSDGTGVPPHQGTP